MGSRLKVFLSSIVVIIASLGVVFLATQGFVLNRFAQLESQTVRQDAQLAKAILEREFSSLETITGNWAESSGVRQFLQDYVPAVTQTNNPFEDLNQPGVDSVLLFAQNRDLIYGRVRNQTTNYLAPVPTDFRSLPQSYNLFQRVDSDQIDVVNTGMVETSLGKMVFSTMPVIGVEGDSELLGYLLFGRYLDIHNIVKLGSQNQIPLDAWSTADTAAPADIQSVTKELKSAPDFVVVTTPKWIELLRGTRQPTAYFAISGLDGKPNIIIRVNSQRQLYQAGVNSMRVYGLMLVVIGLICAAATIIYFDRSILSRMQVIEERITSFRKTRDFNQRIRVNGNDEVTRLAEAVNASFEEFGHFQENQIKTERQFREALQNLSLAAVILDTEGRIVFCNDYILNISGWQEKELINHLWCYRFISEENRMECRREITEAAKTGRITAHEDTEFVLRNGKTRMFSWSNTLLSGYNGVVTGIVRIGEDVTERRKAESMLRDSLCETRMHLSRLTALRKIDSTITSSMDTMEKIDSVLSTIQESLDVESIDILRISPEEDSMIPIATRGLSKEYLDITPILPSDPMFQRLQGENLPILLMNPSKEDLPRWVKSRVNGSQWIAFYGAAPMISGSRLIGILEVFSKLPFERDNGWADHFKSLALQATITLENDAMIQGIHRANLELEQAYEATLVGWARALELRDKETRGHSERMMELTMRLGRRLGMDASELEVLGRGVLLHDIGKMGVPDYILHKPGPLTDEEWVIMRQHPQFAHNLLKNIPYLSGALDVAFCHHEHWDGNGYPRGLAGEEIPFSARVFAIVDVWDALTHDRPYRPAWPDEEALNYIYSQRNTQFDPKIVEAFVKMLDDNRLRQTAPLPVHFVLD